MISNVTFYKTNEMFPKIIDKVNLYLPPYLQRQKLCNSSPKITLY